MIVTNTNSRFRFELIFTKLIKQAQLSWQFFIFFLITFSCICAFFFFLLIASSWLVFSLCPCGDDNIVIQIKLAVPYSIFVDRRVIVIQIGASDRLRLKKIFKKKTKQTSFASTVAWQRITITIVWYLVSFSLYLLPWSYFFSIAIFSY